MIEIKIELPTLDREFRDIEQTFSEFVTDVAREIRSRTESNLEQTGHTGRRYRKKSGRVHIASAVGEPPARDTGNLWGSLTAVRSDADGAEFEVRAPYGNYLEFALHRPFLMPAIDYTLETRSFTF